jgi:hypothetical protein
MKGPTTVREDQHSALAAWSARLRPQLHNKRILVPAALAFTLVVVAALLLGALGQQRASASRGNQAGNRPLLVARADIHAESVYQGGDLELNASITQTANDCQQALNGGVCLRYSVVLDEKPVMVGYGVIPLSAVHITPSSIMLNVDTSKIPTFVNSYGSGGRITISWKTVSGAQITRPNAPTKAVVVGGIDKFTFPGSGIIATMIYH